jgi:divalent metal cation (Fe/Co/Zn/Cd) transporter
MFRRASRSTNKNIFYSEADDEKSDSLAGVGVLANIIYAGVIAGEDACNG